MEPASLVLLLLLASPAVLFTKDVTAARDASSIPGVKLQQLERLQQYQHQQQEGRKPWEREKQVLENKIKSIHAELRSERLQWVGQQQTLENYVKSLAAELKSEKQKWLGQKQTLENYVKSLAAELKSEKQEWLGQKQTLEKYVNSLAAEFKSEKQEWLEQKQSLENYVKSLVAEHNKSEKQEWLGQKQSLENYVKSLVAEHNKSEKQEWLGQKQTLENYVKSLAAELKSEKQEWLGQKLTLEKYVKSLAAELKSEKQEWLGQKLTLEKYVKSLAAELTLEKQEWLGQKQTLENKAESLQAEVQILSLKVNTPKNTLSGQTSSIINRGEYAAEDNEQNMELSPLQIEQPVEKRSVNMQTLDVRNGSTVLQQLELKMVHELRALNTTLTHDVQQLRTAMTSATHDLDLMQNQLTAVKQTAFIALREASHVQSEVNKNGRSSRQRLDGATKTLQDELVLIVKVLNAKTDTEVNRLTAAMVSQTGSLTHTVAIATQGVREMGSRLQAVDSRVQAIEQSVTRQDTTIQQAGGSVYTRWGKVACHKDTQLVYHGIMAGGDKASGSMLCLPSDLAFTQLAQSAPRDHSQILGADFQISGTLQQHEQLSCAVCQPPRSTTITVPATTECPHGWTREYHGHLISGAPDSAPHDLFCMDDQPRSHSDPVAAASVSVSLYYTVIACGSLPCNKYPNGTVVTCAVCSL